MQIVLFLFLSVVYLHNLSQSVYGGDVGDLVTAAYLFGVPHPPGYPLFTFLGFILSRFTQLFGQTPAYMVGTISAFASAGAVVIYYSFIRRVTRNTLLSFISALTLAFTFLFWFYAEIAEVFALNNFFAVLLLFLAYLYKEKKDTRLLYALSFFTALSVTNHHTIIFVFPSVLILAGRTFFTQIKSSKKVILWCLLSGLIGFSFYLYAVVASLTRPLIDWANITNVQSFFDLVLRKKYGTFQLAAFHNVTPAARLVVLKTYVMLLFTQVTIPVILFSLLGVAALLRRDRILALALSLAFLLTGPVFIVYAGFFLNNSFYFGIYERFLSLSVVILLLFFPFGLLAFTSTLSRFFSRREYQYLFQGIFILIPLMLFLYNQPKTNLSQVWTGDILAENHVNVLPKKSLLFLSGDTNLFNTWYIRYAKGVRPDVDVLNGLGPEKAVQLFGSDYHLSQRSDFYALVQKIDKKRPVFSDLRFTTEKLDGSWVPFGLYYEFRSSDEAKLTLDEYEARTKKIWTTMKLPSKDESEKIAANNHTIAVIPEMYANGLVVAGNYFLSEYAAKDKALAYYKKALEVDPNYSKAYATIGAFYFTNEKKCKEAIPFLKKAIDLYQFDKNYYFLLSLAYRECNIDQDDQTELQDAFFRTYGVSLPEALKAFDSSQTTSSKP